jgi:AcrR family transcriptional regulator
VLSEAEIVEAAQILVREHGAGALSMRNVARALGVPPMTLYGYVPSREALDTLLIDRMLSGVRISGPDEGTWDVRLRILLCDARHTLVKRPEAGTCLGRGALQLLQRGVYGKEATRLAEGVLDLLREGGFRPDDLQPCFVTLFTFVTGYVEADLLNDLPPRDGTTHDKPRGDATFAIGVEALIEGLKVVLRPARPELGRPGGPHDRRSSA